MKQPLSYLRHLARERCLPFFPVEVARIKNLGFRADERLRGPHVEQPLLHLRHLGFGAFGISL